jgi:hypothetical protein
VGIPDKLKAEGSELSEKIGQLKIKLKNWGGELSAKIGHLKMKPLQNVTGLKWKS